MCGTPVKATQIKFRVSLLWPGQNKDFLMSQPIAGLNTRIGTCPHGMPMGACPICNGGGGGTSKVMTNARKPGEMTWSQCFAAGQLMKQAETRGEAKIQAQMQNIQLAEQVQKNISTYINNVQNTISILRNSSSPTIAKAIDFLNQTIITPFLNILSKIPKLIQSLQNGMENIRNAIINVAEKLATFLGEMKNFVNKKISDFIKNATKKVFAFFSLTSTEEEEETETEGFLEVFTSKKN